MAVTRLKRSSILDDPKYISFLAGNTPYSAGVFESIGTVTVGAGGASSVTFSSIPSTYKHLQIRLTATPTSADNFAFQFNGDTAANYSYHYLAGSGSSATAGNGVSISNGYLGYASTASYPTSVILDILDYSNTSKYKTTRDLLGNDANGSGYIMLSSSLWSNTAAISSILLKCDAQSFISGSTFALYGVK